MRSPPTSRAIDARSSVDVTTLSFDWASAGPASSAKHAARRARVVSHLKVMAHLKGMRAVRADRELELKQKLVGNLSRGVVGSPKLPADLTELAGPVGHRQRTAPVDEQGIVGARTSIIASAGEPAAGELIVAGDIEAVAALKTIR